MRIVRNIIYNLHYCQSYKSFAMETAHSKEYSVSSYRFVAKRGELIVSAVKNPLLSETDPRTRATSHSGIKGSDMDNILFNHSTPVWLMLPVR